MFSIADWTPAVTYISSIPNMANPDVSATSTKPVRIITFHPSGDLDIRCRAASGKLVALLMVSVHDLLDYANAELLEVLRSNEKPRQEVVDIQDDNLMGVVLCLGITHNTLDFHS
jgi:ABC-type uncharacterized transport system YnjBCD permease subunit